MCRSNDGKRKVTVAATIPCLQNSRTDS
jgi:hypothetical protein